MKHYGDITKIKGSDVPTVDILTGGSPCQDLSIGGKREGLKGERSSLFDGIGGFPLVFQRAGVRPVWASEIEEFPIAVTKKHFKED